MTIPGLCTVFYSQQQALHLAGIEKATFVYWMRTVPRIKRLKGGGCHFTTSDVLALGVLCTATQELGISIGSLTRAIDELFELVKHEQPSDLASYAVIFAGATPKLERMPVVVTGELALAIVPLEQIVRRLRNEVNGETKLHPLERLMLGLAPAPVADRQP